MLSKHANSAGTPALLERARAELQDRLRSGEPCRAEEFLSVFPSLASDPDAAVSLIVAEILTRRELGERADFSECCVRFPQWRDRLEQKLGSLITSASDSGTQAESSGSSATPLVPLGQHEVYEEIGHGGMGIVCRARDLALGREVALKRIRSGALTGSEVERFHREARAAAQLHHPNIVPIYAVGLLDGSPCYTMRRVTGGTLGNHLDEYLQDRRAAVTLLAKVARAVHAAHEAGVIHRDLKPGNILLDEQGEPLVADFGLAKLAEADVQVTRTGQALGTPAYMAPEQLADQGGPITAATDVWALGIILYQLLVGHRPFEGRGRLLETQILGAEPPWPRALPRGLGAIALKCLEKAPVRRYRSAAELADDLEAWRDGRPTRVRPARGVQRVLRGVRRRPLVALAVAVVLAAALGVPAVRHLTHPDRALWLLQEQVQPGGTLELIGPRGAPRWWQFCLGEKDAKAFVDNDGAFTVHGWPLALLELLPDTRGQGNYVICADVRHIKGGDGGAVGLYFARSVQGDTPVQVHAFLYVSFDDLHDMVEQYERLPIAQRQKIPECKGNAVRLSWRCIGEGDKPALIHEVGFLNPEVFRPSGFQGRPANWVTLRIEVDAEQVRVTWADKVVGATTLARIEKRQREVTARLQQKDPNLAVLAGQPPRLDRAGGLGLYLYESYASFRNVRIEFRPAPANPPERGH